MSDKNDILHKDLSLIRINVKNIYKAKEAYSIVLILLFYPFSARTRRFEHVD